MQGNSTSVPGHDGNGPGDDASHGVGVAGDAAEVARLRRRLAFYEGFDDLIQQNISRSGDLLRLAAERQAEAERELAAERAELARTAATQRDLLAALATEVATVRTGLDALAGRLETARNELDRIAAAGQDGQPTPERPTAAPAATLPGAPARQPVAATGDDRRTGSVIVHGIAGVEDARSYQTWLASRPGVRSVTPREFSSGILRLDVAATPFPGADAAGWPGHALDVVDVGPGATVLRLRGATGL